MNRRESGVLNCCRWLGKQRSLPFAYSDTRVFAFLGPIPILTALPANPFFSQDRRFFLTAA